MIKQQSKIRAVIALLILSGSFAVLSAQPVSRGAAISKAQQLLQSEGLYIQDRQVIAVP